MTFGLSMAQKEAPGGDLWIPGLGWPSGLLRFVAIFFFDLYMSTSSQLYEAAKDLDTLQNAPYNPDIVRTVQLSAKWVRRMFLVPLLLDDVLREVILQSRIGYIWNLAAWIPTLVLPSFMVIVIGAFDLTIVGLLSNITVLEQQFVPANKDQCARESTWRADGTKTFFGIIGDNTEPAASASGICKDFFRMRHYGFGALYVILSYLLLDCSC